MKFFEGGKYSYIAVAAADLLSFIVGTASAWSSPVIPKLQTLSDNPLGRQISQDEASWIGSLLSMGGIVSPLIWAYLVQKVGRKISGIVVVIPFLVAYLTSAFAETIELYYFGRVLMGIGIGGMFCVLPIYVVEVAEDVNRGLLAASTGCFLVAGMLFSYSIGPFVSIMAFNLILTGVVLVYIPAFWFFSPETPYYLVRENQDQKALKSLRYLRRRPLADLEAELTQIKKYLASMTEGTFLGIFQTKASIKAFIYSVALTTFQQFSGINVIFSYMQNIFDLTGSDIAPEICSIIVASVQLVSSFMSPLLSDKAGRRTLLLVSITGATICEVVLGVYFYLQDNDDDVSGIGWLPVVSLVVFMMFYNFGMGSLPWAIMPEILPSNVISKASLIVTCIYWFVGWILTQYFAELMEAVGGAGSFWLFSGFCVLFDLFVFFFIFETKGKSLQEIQQILSR
ncbi:hypothetical protein Zmor_025418 [Zophobas morio]|uniref:Major facilitator superfamily (MFS) profile domain-containing protein n=1 Tax=Zophobas morio TaxID=2755281 RepID=A0AA38HTA0_9CUCU|nr:hypothetical protein Zmor_025418 [Zophobas morio]